MLESVKGCFMKCGDCNNSIRVGCSYDVTKLQCPITGEVNGFFDECDIAGRQKLIWLLSGKKLILHPMWSMLPTGYYPMAFPYYERYRPLPKMWASYKFQ